MSRPKLTLSNETKGQEHRESKLYAYENVWFSKKTKSVKSGTGLSLFRGVIPNVSVAVAYTEGGVCTRARCAARARRLGAQRSRPSSSLSRARLSRSSLSLSLSLFFLIFFPPFSLSSKSRSPMKSVLSIFRLRNLIGDRPYIRGEGFLFKQSSGFNTRQNCATKCNFYSHIPKGGDSRAFWMKK